MPNVGGPAASLTAFIGEIQTKMYDLIADLTSRVNVLEESAAAPVQSSATTTYVSIGQTESFANLSPGDELLNASPSSGSTIIPGGTLQVGSIVTINMSGSFSTGMELTMGFRLWGSSEPPLITAYAYLPGPQGGGLNVTYILTMREASVVVTATVAFLHSISTYTATIEFNRAIDCPFTIVNSWSDPESGGEILIESRSIEIKHPPA